MAPRRLILEFGMGTSLRRQDYTAAAKRAVEDALWRNSIALAEHFGRDRDEMILDVEIGVQSPDAVDTEAVKAVFPYGRVSVRAVPGGLDLPRPEGGAPTIMANAVIAVSLDLAEGAA